MFAMPMMMKAASGSSFDPSTALVWLDPSDLTSMWTDTARTTPVSADGQAVASILNKGTAGGYFEQATAGKQPLYKTAGGLHWLLTDGIDDDLSVSSRFGLAANPNLTIVQGMRVLNASSFRYSFALGSFVATNGIILLENGTDWGFRHGDGNRLFNAVTADTDYVATWRRTAGSNYGASRFFLNAVERSQTAVGNPTNVPTSTDNAAMIGGLPGAYTNNRMYGFLLMEADSDSMQASAESWMAAKAGVTL